MIEQVIVFKQCQANGIALISMMMNGHTVTRIKTKHHDCNKQKIISNRDIKDLQTKLIKSETTNFENFIQLILTGVVVVGVMKRQLWRCCGTTNTIIAYSQNLLNALRRIQIWQVALGKRPTCNRDVDYKSRQRTITQPHHRRSFQHVSWLAKPRQSHSKPLCGPDRNRRRHTGPLPDNSWPPRIQIGAGASIHALSSS